MFKGEITKDNLEEKKKELKDVLWKLRTEVNKTNKLSESSLDEFLEAAKFLNSLLKEPSDPNLTDIDDLLYEDHDEKGEAKEYLEHEDSGAAANSYFCLYHELYLYYVSNFTNAKCILDLTYLKLVDCTTTAILKLHMGKYKTYAIIVSLISTRCTNKVCQGLKLLKVCLEKHTIELVQQIQDNLRYTNHTLAWITDLPDIPQARVAKQRRITSWIAATSRIVVELLKKEGFDFESRKVLRSSYEQNTYIYKLLEEFRPRSYTLMDDVYFSPVAHFHDGLLSYFLKTASSNDRKARELRLKSLIRNCNRYMSYSRNVDEEEETAVFIRHLGMLFYTFLASVENIVKNLGDDIHQLPSIVNQYDFEPYLPEGEQRVKENTEQQDNSCNDNKVSDNNDDADDIPSDEPDYTVEKYLYFDDFMKYLRLLSIMNEAVLNLKELLSWSEGEIDGHDSRAIRASETIEKFIKDRFHNKSKRGNIPWLIKIMFDKCPFLFCDPRIENLKDELSIMLNGEDIDEYIEEKLFYSINYLRQ